MTINEILILGMIGMGAGVLSGMFGIGGGVLIVPAMVFFLGMTQHGAQGTSIGLMLLPIGIMAAMNYYKAGNLNVKYSLVMAVTFVVGGYLGSKLSLNMSELTLKRSFGILMLMVSLKMIFFSK